MFLVLYCNPSTGEDHIEEFKTKKEVKEFVEEFLERDILKLNSDIRVFEGEFKRINPTTVIKTVIIE